MKNLTLNENVCALYIIFRELVYHSEEAGHCTKAFVLLYHSYPGICLHAEEYGYCMKTEVHYTCYTTYTSPLFLYLKKLIVVLYFVIQEMNPRL